VPRSPITACDFAGLLKTLQGFRGSI